MAGSLLTHLDRTWNYKPALVLVCLMVVVFFVWASVAKIDQLVRGTGRVIPAGKARTIANLEGGILNEIFVTEGQIVDVGDVLFDIGNQKARSDLQEAQIIRDSLYIRMDRLQAERQGKSQIVVTDKDLGRTYPKIVESEAQLFEARQREFEEKIGGLKKQLRQKELKLDDLFTRIDDLNNELNIINEQLGIKAKLLKSGAISRSVYLETESRAKNFVTRINAAKKEVPITQSELQEIYSNIEEEKQKRNTQIIEDINEVNVDISTLTERIKGLQDEVTRTAVTSPIKGIINKLYVNTIGGVVSPGQELADLVPLEETLILEGKVSTNDRGKIWTGLPVTAKITAYDYTIYGGMKGTLEHISADSFIDNSGQEYYTVRIRLSADKLDEDQPIHPGMTADLNILAGEVTVLYAILRPFHRIRDNAFRDF